ncbi:MAG: M56 family metallopeptidase [Roseburia sp.]
MLDQIFMNVIDMSRVASIIIVIVLIARVFLKRYPKYISYALWSVVLFRLLCPFSFEFAFSLVPKLEPTSYQYTLVDDAIPAAGADDSIPTTGTGPNQEMNQAGEMNLVIDHDVNGKSEVFDIQTATSSTDKESRNVEVSWQEVCILLGKYVWLLGIGIMFLYSVVSLIKIRKKVSVSLRLRDNIYIADGKISPFVMGVFRPRIYLPDCLSEKEQEYIILHERYHIRRLDHVIKLLAFLALSIHWFNPLVWVAFIVSGKDMEMSCDEAVIRKMGDNIRADYAQSLLALATGHGSIRGIPLAFGEGDTKSRVKNLAKSKKTKRWVLAIVILAVAVLILCLISNAKTINENKAKEDDLVTDDTSVSDEVIDTYEQVNISQVDIPYALSEMAMCNRQEGWALTTDHEILFTDSGVENFSVVRRLEGVSSANDGFVDICAVDYQTVYATYVSEDRSLIVEYTKDGGTSWQQTVVDLEDEPVDGGGSAYISFSDAEHGYLLYCSSPAGGLMMKLLFYTENAGESFSFAGDLSDFNGYPQGISFSGGKCYIGVTYHGQDDYMYVKESGTEIWEGEEVIPLPNGSRYIDGFAPVFDLADRQEGMLVLKAVGDDARYLLLVTKDGGEYWNINGEIPLESLRSYYYVGNNQFYYIDNAGGLYFSEAGTMLYQEAIDSDGNDSEQTDFVGIPCVFIGIP